MRHLLMDPAFPDIVGEWAALTGGRPANDNREEEEADEFADLFLLEIARRDIEANRAW
ncbi:MAG: hypothetical protein JO276_02220 [Sphingomonadaceae bacterium]|nr:hypothetical protein [Sphingomonas sp.]MBV9881805.1 hypothetical protein [Sphingomonadaceae bacterium]